MKPQPTKLYKYLNPARLNDALRENGTSTLRLSPTSVLNDPFEVMPGLDEFVSEARMAKVVSKMQAAFPEDAPTDSMYRKELQLRRFRREFVARHRALFDSMLGFVSLSAKPISTLMWAHYADSFKGFVVGYDFDAIEALVPDDYSGVLAEVQYEVDRPKWADMDTFEREEDVNQNIITCYSTKSKSWEYEEEWRLILPIHLARLVGEIRVIDIPSSAVSEILISEFTDEKLVSQIAARAAGYASATIRRVFPSKTTFECNIEAVDEF